MGASKDSLLTVSQFIRQSLMTETCEHCGVKLSEVPDEELVKHWFAECSKKI